LGDTVKHSLTDLWSTFRRTILLECTVIYIYLCNRSKARRSNLSAIDIKWSTKTV